MLFLSETWKRGRENGGENRRSVVCEEVKDFIFRFGLLVALSLI